MAVASNSVGSRLQTLSKTIVSFAMTSNENTQKAKKIKTENIRKHENPMEPSKRKRKPKIQYEDEKPIKSDWEPENWHKILENIEKMRLENPAPVDTMGCHKCSDETNKNPKIYRYQTLIALMLSSQTKDNVTHNAMKKLISHGLTIDSIVTTDTETLEKLIYPVSFYKRKVKYLKNTSEILKNDYDYDVPPTAEALCRLPGVGPKMAHLCMQTAWGEVSGIGVDTHVHRISNRLKFVEKSTKTPETTRIALEKWLPKELWDKINILFVGFGQQICLPVNPKCQICLNRDICPSSKYKN